MVLQKKIDALTPEEQKKELEKAETLNDTLVERLKQQAQTAAEELKKMADAKRMEDARLAGIEEENRIIAAEEQKKKDDAAEQKRINDAAEQKRIDDRLKEEEAAQKLEDDLAAVAAGETPEVTPVDMTDNNPPPPETPAERDARLKKEAEDMAKQIDASNVDHSDWIKVASPSWCPDVSTETDRNHFLQTSDPAGELYRCDLVWDNFKEAHDWRKTREHYSQVITGVEILGANTGGAGTGGAGQLRGGFSYYNGLSNLDHLWWSGLWQYSTAYRGYYAGIHPDSYVGAPLTGSSNTQKTAITATWKAHFQATALYSTGRNSNGRAVTTVDTPTLLLVNFATKKVESPDSIGTEKYTIAADYDAQGIMTGTIERDSDGERFTNGKISGIIGTKGLIGVFVANDNRHYGYAGGFVACPTANIQGTGDCQ